MSEQVDTNELYRAPKADLTRESDEGYDQTSALSPKGRFGRIQYLGYGMLASIAGGILIAIFSAVFAATGVKQEAVVVISLAVYAILIPISIIFVIRRLHDLNRTGWVFLAFLIPLVNFILALILLFVPGTKGTNKYGPPPQPPSRLASFGVIVLFLVFFFGTIASVAIPAYQAYAKAAQDHNTSHQVEAPPPAN